MPAIVCHPSFIFRRTARGNPRLITAKLRLKIEDNRIHSNGEVRPRDLRDDFQQSQSTR
jgi:hypothetical protein